MIGEFFARWSAEAVVIGKYFGLSMWLFFGIFLLGKVFWYMTYTIYSMCSVLQASNHSLIPDLWTKQHSFSEHASPMISSSSSICPFVIHRAFPFRAFLAWILMWSNIIWSISFTLVFLTLPSALPFWSRNSPSNPPKFLIKMSVMSLLPWPQWGRLTSPNGSWMHDSIVLMITWR